jgi:hypothetical protein
MDTMERTNIMGATTFFTTAKGKSLTNAYNNAVDQATYDYGNDPYNGTISTTDGVINKTHVLKSMIENSSTEREALESWVEMAEENTHKWEACWGAHLKEDIYVFSGTAAE